MQGYAVTIKVQRWILAMGIVLLLAKFWAWWLTGSVAILTDALESIVNVVAGAITLYSLWLAARPRDASHPYGHGKAEFISAGIEGTLIVVAGLYIIYEAIHKIFYPAPVDHLPSGMALVGFSGLANLVAGMVALRTGQRYNSPAIMASGRHLLTDAGSTAALLVGLGLLYFFRWSWIDSLVALAMAVYIVITGYGIVRQSIGGIMDEADQELLERMVNYLNENRQPNWVDMHNLRVIKYGSRLHIDCHLTLPWYLNLQEAHLEIDNLTKLMKNAVGESVELFIHSDDCKPFSCRICGKRDCEVRQYPQREKLDWTMDNLLDNRKHSMTHVQLT